MLPGDAAAVRRPLGATADETRHPSALNPPGLRSQKTRRKSKPLTRAFAASRPSGGAGPVPPETPSTPGGDPRRALVQPPRDIAPSPPPFRFWVDELLWSQGRVAVELVEQVLGEAGGVRTGGPSRQEERARRRLELTAEGQPGLNSAPRGPSLGSQHMDAWEVLWTKSTYAIPAARNMRPGQLVSAIIGLNSLTMKKRLLLTLRGVLGSETAFSIMPRSFALPEELDEWAAWVWQQQKDIKKQRDRSSSSSSLWILKTGQDAGKGLSLLPADLALKYAKEEQRQRQEQRALQGAGGSSSRRFQLQVAQQYVGDPFLIHGRKFHLRLWLLVTAHSPLRAYLHRRGLVLFSSELYDKNAAAEPAGSAVTSACASTTSSSTASGTTAAASGSPMAPRLDATADVAPYQPPASHVTNYARNANTMVWGLRQLEEHLGPERFGGLWTRICRSCGAALAAAAPSLAEANAWLQPAVQEYGFQVMGVDYLLDGQLAPWLLEFNSAPSIMVQHECAATRALVYEQKYGMLRDTWEVVRWRVYPPGGPGEAVKGCTGTGAGTRRSGESTARWEAAHAGEYETLLPYIQHGSWQHFP